MEIADFGGGRIVLRDVFFASIFLVYVEPFFFFAFGRENSPVQPLSTPTLDGFFDGHKDFLQLYRLLSTFSTVDHVKNAQSCVNRVNMHIVAPMVAHMRNEFVSLLAC